MPFKDNQVCRSLVSKFRSSSFKHPSRSIYTGQWRTRSLRLPSSLIPERSGHPTGDLSAAKPDKVDFDDCAFHDGESRLCRVRSFKTTRGGFENRGDSFRKRSRSGVPSEVGSLASDKDKQRLSSTSSDVSNVSEVSDISTWTTISGLSSLAPSYYRIVFLGASGVGKTSLLRQCMTSDFTNAFETASQDDEEDDNTICVLLDGEESMVELLDNKSLGECELMKVDAYIIAFSVSCVASFKVATSIIQQLRVERSCDRAIVLVANKVDLVRQRKVKEEDVRRLANKYNCKCVETSTAINHNVDNLVVGTLTQIRLKLDPPASDLLTNSDEVVFPKRPPFNKKLKALSFISRLFKHAKRRAQSCENLLT